MSTEEQDAIAGRLVREYAELRKQLALALVKAESHARSYADVAAYMHSRNRSNGGLRYGSPDGILATLPDVEQVRMNCAEVLRLIERRQQVFASLKEAGLEPKEQPTFD